MEQSMAALADTLAFVAAELGSPLLTVMGCIEVVASRHLSPGPHVPPGIVQFGERYPGELITALDRAQKRAALCHSLLATLLQSTRSAEAAAQAQARVGADSLVKVLLEEFPFERWQRSVVATETAQDFLLPPHRHLIYMVLTLLMRSALEAVDGTFQPCVHLEVGCDEPDRSGWISIHDNAPRVVGRASVEGSGTHPGIAHDDTSLLFCERVMRSLHGLLQVRSAPGVGTTVKLYFPLDCHD